MLLVDRIYELNSKARIGLVIVDSLTSLFREEYTGRGTLASRQQKLNRHLHDLLRVARQLNAAVVVTNQMMDKPDTFFGDPEKPIGGHVLGHTATFRIWLKRSRGNLRITRLVDSPYLPDGEAVVKVSERGVEDGSRSKGRGSGGADAGKKDPSPK